MKKSIYMRLIALLLVFCLAIGLAWTVSAAYPTHTDYIYDGANILTPALVDTLKSTNDTLYSKVEARISLCIVESLGGEEIHTYSRNLFKEWKLGEGVLLVISTGDENYYAVQSVKIDDVLTNTELDSILKNFMEPDFAEGNISRGIQKTVNKLASFLKSELPAASADEPQTGDTENEGTVTFGSVVLSVLRILGWTALVLIAAFVIFFVAALFNDTAAELMNRLVFSHFTGKKKPSRNRDYYDERLYGQPRNPNRPNPNGRPRPQQNGQMYDRYRQGGVRYDDEYYGGQQNVRRNPGSRPQQNGQPARRPNPTRGTPVNPDYEETRQFNINNSRK